MAMSDQNGGERARDAALLPWYVTKKLPPEDAARLDWLIGEDDMLADHVRQIREEAGATIEANEAAGAPSAAVLHRLMDAVADDAAKRSQGNAWRARVAGLFELSPAPSRWRVAGALAVLVIVAQAAIIGALLLRAPGPADAPRYDTASGPGAEQAAGPGFLVRFANAAVEVIKEFEKVTGAVIVEGPKPGGLYRLAAADPAKGFAPDAARALQSSHAVALVLPAR